MSLVEKIRPLLTLKTPLGDIPAEWLRWIEPKIVRSEDGCWRWQGAFDSEGEPLMFTRNPANGKRATQRVKRVVAKLFFAIKPYHDVLHKCDNLDCVNPSHLEATSSHWKQR